MLFLLSTFLIFVGLAAALAVLVANALQLRSAKPKWMALVMMAVSLLYLVSLLFSLVRQSSGIACAQPDTRTLIVFGGLLLLHLYFLFDTLRTSKN